MRQRGFAPECESDASERESPGDVRPCKEWSGWTVGSALGNWSRSVTSHEYSERVREEGTRTKRTFSSSKKAWVSMKDKQDPGDPGGSQEGKTQSLDQTSGCFLDHPGWSAKG